MRLLILNLGLVASFLAASALQAQPTAPVFTIDTLAGVQNLGDGGPAAQALLFSPSGIAVDQTGNIYIADRRYNRIRRITPAGIISTIAGTGVFGFGGNGGLATSAQIGAVFGLALTSAGNLFFADSNSTVRAIGNDGIIRQVAGSTPGFGGDNEPALQAQFLGIRGIAFDAGGNLYVADQFNHRVRRIASQGTVSTVAGTGTAGFSGDSGPASAAQLSFPSDVTVDAGGNIYVVDAGNLRVRVIDASGTIRTLAGGPGAQPQFGNPSGITVDSARNVFVTDLALVDVRRIAPDGNMTVIAGGGSGFSGDGGLATSARLDTPTAVALDGSGNVLITDTQNDRIRRVAGGTINTIAGRHRRLGTRAATAEVFAPVGLDTSGGNVLIASFGSHQILRVNMTGEIQALAGFGGRGGASNGPANQVAFNFPQDVFMAGADVYIADAGNHQIRRLDANGRVTTFAGGTAGFADGTVAAARLLNPLGVLAAGSDVLVGDTGNNRLRRVREGNVTTIAGTGQAGFAGDGGQAAAAQLNGPMSLARDSAGNVYFADTLNHRVRVLAPDGTISTLAGNGTAGFAGDGGQPEMAQLSAPQGVAVDRNNNVYIADSGNNLVRMIVRGAASAPGPAAAGDVIFTIAGNSTPGFSGDGGRAVAASLNAPVDVAVDAQGVVYIADSANDRVRRLTPMHARFTAAGLVNSASFRVSPATPGGLFTLFGTDLASRIEVNSASPLPEQLAGTSVELTDSRGTRHACGMVSVTPGQISFVIPSTVALGAGTLTVRRDGVSIGSAPVQVEAVSPGLFAAAATGRGVAAAVAIRVEPDGTQVQVPVFTVGGGGIVASPIDVSADTGQIFLLLFGTGIRDFRSVTVTGGGDNLPVLGAAAQGQFAGLDQINVGPLSPSLAGRGEIEIVATVDGKLSNAVTIRVQ